MPKKKKRPGHYCWVCGRHRANERFSGKGHARHICRDCSRNPTEIRRLSNLNDLYGYLNQSRISPLNVARAQDLSQSPDANIRDLAQLVVKLGQVHPYKKRRLKNILQSDRELAGTLVRLLYGDELHEFEDDGAEDDCEAEWGEPADYCEPDDSQPADWEENWDIIPF